MSKLNSGDYPECDTCINREHDPFACEDCDEGSNYEPEDTEDEDDDFEELPYDKFITWIREIA